MSGDAMTGDSGVIEAGGIAVGTSNNGGSQVDTVTARSYRHPALDEDRVVVRLVPATLGEAEDLVMEFLGFAAGGEPRPVGIGARQALGFPAWACRLTCRVGLCDPG